MCNNENVKSLDELQKMSEADDEKSFEQIIEAEKQKEKMAALGQLAGGIAHDFNNQLMSIIGNATMIQKTDDLKKINDYAERIIHISQSTASLTKKILVFSKKDSSINEPVNLKNVMDNTYNMIELILDKKINLNYRYSAIHKMIMGDESQLESLIINLIINARDAIEDIPEEPSIEIGTEDTEVLMDMHLSHGEVIKPGKYIKLYVKDNGSGMSKDTLGRIFEPYFTTKNKSKGTGLGLSVVFGTVRSHSGFINVESQESLGTCFEIFFPVLENNIESPEEKIKKVLESNLIMLVDDDLNVLDIEAELLEDLGYDVMKFFNPIDALQYYMNEYEKLGFVVLDMMMPQMSGKMLYKELQKINKDVTAIFISGYTGQADYEELIRNGSIVIEKPFTVGDLSSQIAKIYM